MGRSAVGLGANKFYMGLLLYKILKTRIYVVAAAFYRMSSS